MTKPKPVTKHNHPAPAWVWTDAELRWIAERDAAWQAAMASAVAAERDACAKVCSDMYTNGDGSECWLRYAADVIRRRSQS